MPSRESAPDADRVIEGPEASVCESHYQSEEYCDGAATNKDRHSFFSMLEAMARRSSDHALEILRAIDANADP